MKPWKSFVAAAVLALASSTAAMAARTDLVLGMPLEPPHLDPTAGAAAAIDEVLYANVFEASARTAAAMTDFQRFMAALPLRNAARIEARIQGSVNQFSRKCEMGSEMAFQFKPFRPIRAFQSLLLPRSSRSRPTAITLADSTMSSMPTHSSGRCARSSMPGP